jgi:hypothetical protein
MYASKASSCVMANTIQRKYLFNRTDLVGSRLAAAVTLGFRGSYPAANLRHIAVGELLPKVA